MPNRFTDEEYGDFVTKFQQMPKNENMTMRNIYEDDWVIADAIKMGKKLRTEVEDPRDGRLDKLESIQPASAPWHYLYRRTD